MAGPRTNSKNVEEDARQSEEVLSTSVDSRAKEAAPGNAIIGRRGKSEGWENLSNLKIIVEVTTEPGFRHPSRHRTSGQVDRGETTGQ